MELAIVLDVLLMLLNDALKARTVADARATEPALSGAPALRAWKQCFGMLWSYFEPHGEHIVYSLREVIRATSGEGQPHGRQDPPPPPKGTPPR